MNEMLFVGYSFGSFTTDSGNKQGYCNVFMLEPFTGEQSPDYQFDGQKAAKYKCSSVDVFRSVPIGSSVSVYFDSKGKICFMQIVKK